MSNFWRKNSGPGAATVIRGRWRMSYVLIAGVVLGLLLAPQGFVSRALYRRLGGWLQQHLCESAFGSYSVTGLILAAVLTVALLLPIAGACFWIRHGLRMAREKTNDLPGHRPLFDTELIEGPAAVRGGWIEVAAGAFVILACSFLLLWPLVGAEGSVFLRDPAEMEACKATAVPAGTPGLASTLLPSPASIATPEKTT
jgi:hypothetical protein